MASRRAGTIVFRKSQLSRVAGVSQTSMIVKDEQ